MRRPRSNPAPRRRRARGRGRPHIRVRRALGHLHRTAGRVIGDFPVTLTVCASGSTGCVDSISNLPALPGTGQVLVGVRVQANVSMPAFTSNGTGGAHLHRQPLLRRRAGAPRPCGAGHPLGRVHLGGRELLQHGRSAIDRRPAGLPTRPGRGALRGFRVLARALRPDGDDDAAGRHPGRDAGRPHPRHGQRQPGAAAARTSGMAVLIGANRTGTARVQLFQGNGRKNRKPKAGACA